MKTIKLLIALSLLSNLNVAEASLFSKKAKRKLASVNNEIRLTHAKELLGNKSFQKSPVKHTAAFKAVNKFILLSATQSLSKKWKENSLQVTNAVIVEANRYNFDPLFLMAVMKHESSFNPDAIGGVGEIGLMQIRPETAKWIADMYKIKWNGAKALKDPVYNVKIGSAYLDYLRGKFDHGQLYLSAYNMGPKGVKNALSKNIWPKIYSSNVMRHYIELNQQLLTYLHLNHPQAQQIIASKN
ncbi:MAG: lytic transglycosylase domain-containing protein [Bdellovibrionales bacterium]